MFGHNRKNSSSNNPNVYSLSDDEEEDSFIPINIDSNTTTTTTNTSSNSNNNNNNTILVNRDEDESEEDDDMPHRAILNNNSANNNNSNNNNNNEERDLESLDHHHHFQHQQNLVDIVYRCCFSKVFIKAIALFVGVLGLLLTVILLSVSFASVSNTNNVPSSKFAIYPPKLQIPLWVLDLTDSERIKQHVRYLSDDNLQGRLPGSIGEELTVSYIESIFKTSYLEPFGDGTISTTTTTTSSTSKTQTTLTTNNYRQTVPLYAYKTLHHSEMVFKKDGKEISSLVWNLEFLAGTGIQYQKFVNLTDVPIVFVGYGISMTDKYSWDDYSTVDVKNKIVVSLVGFPSDIFNTDTSYTARWVYKYQEAQRHGALGAILIHTDESAGYGWSVLENGFIKEQISNDQGENSTDSTSLALTSWITKDAANTLAKALGTSLSDWQTAAHSKEFKAIEYPGVGLSLNMEYPYRKFNATNVVARIKGSVEPDELVVVMAHHDHLGSYIDEKNKTVIFNGAVDNASGVGTMLEVATILGHFNKFIHSSTFSEIGPMKSFNRSIVFVSTTAEESGLLGSQYFINHLLKTMYPLKTADQVFISTINFDIVNTLGETANAVSFGRGLSPQLDGYLKSMGASEKLQIVKDPDPKVNFLYRNDGLSFLEKNVSSLTLGIGTSYIGQPENYFIHEYQEYYKQRYHTPNDIFNEAWTFKGASQQVRLAARLAYYLSATEVSRPPLVNSIY